MLLQKIRNKGIKWFFWRLNSEFRKPTKASTKFILDGLLRIRKKISSTRKDNDHEELLYAIYDLKIAPITFDIIEFLINAEYEANRVGKKGFAIVFVPQEGPADFGWEEYDAIFDSDMEKAKSLREESNAWKFENIVLAITMLVPKCKGIFILPKRSDVFEFIDKENVIPELYDGVNLRHLDVRDFYQKLDRPNLVEGLRATNQGLRYIENWYTKNKIDIPVVSITIRQYEFDKARNSNIKAWVKFAHYLKDSGYFPVIVPDTESAFNTQDTFPDLYVFNEGSWNMGLRMAFYESCYLNFFSPNGPSRLAVWNAKVSYISMNSLPKNSIVTTEEYFKARDHQVGENFKFSLPHQRYVYTPETYEGIVKEFEKFVADDKESLAKTN